MFALQRGIKKNKLFLKPILWLCKITYNSIQFELLIPFSRYKQGFESRCMSAELIYYVKKFFFINFMTSFVGGIL